MTASASGRSAGRALALLAGLMIASAVLTVMLTPVLAHALAVVTGHPASFSQLVLRTLQISSLLLTLLALRWMTPGRLWRSLGLTRGAAAARRFACGFALGLLSVAVVATLLFDFDVRVVRDDLVAEPGFWVSVVLRSLIAALVIALLEEIWFRGALFTLMERAGGAASAVVITSLLYAASHFIVRTDLPGASNAGDALRVLLASSARVVDSGNFDSFLALALGGVWLALARLRHGDVMMCCGIHAGWVLVIKVFKKYTYFDADAELRWMAGSYDEVIGWTAAAVFALIALLAGWRYARQSRSASQ